MVDSMFPDLQDYGLIFVSLAVFGFIILDIFKTGQYWGIPNFYKSNIEKFFHYVSTAILFLSFSLVFIGLALSSPNQENTITKFIKGFFTVFDKIHESGIVSDGSYTIVLKIFAISSFFAFIYIIIYFIVFFSGIYLQLGKAIQLNVFLRDKSEPVKFAGFVSESDDFFFFLKMNGINLWEAIRKEDIARIETIKTRSQLENWIFDFINQVFNFKNKIRIKEYFTKHKKMN
jgi:hypothetical protein